MTAARPSAETPHDKIAALRKGADPRISGAAQPALFPGGPPALAEGRTHEVCGGAARAFAAVQAGLRRGALIWILPPARPGAMSQLAGAERPDPYGLTRFLDPGRLILVESRTEEDVFWAMEEALRSAAAPCVIAEAPARGPLAAADLTRSRRLQLAAEAGRALGLLLPGAEAAIQSNAAETRWRAEPVATLARRPDAPVWDWELLKNKRGPLGRWRLLWRPAQGRASFASTSPHAFAHPSSPQTPAEKHALPAEDPPHPLALAAPSDGGACAAA